MDNITIGLNTDIGSGGKIINNDFHSQFYSQRYPKEHLYKVKEHSIVIGEGCFLGAKAIIVGNRMRIVKENEE